MTDPTAIREVAKILDELILASEVQFAMIGALGEAVGKLLATHDHEAALAFAERFQMGADVLKRGTE